jgi:putative ABC transport system permease protein
MAAHRLDDLLRDIRYALRSLRRTPGFSLVAVLTLGLGLGANAAIFGVLDAAILRPLPYPEAGRIVTVHIRVSEGGRPHPELFPWSYPKFVLFQKNVASYSGVAGYSNSSLNLITPDGPERLETEMVGASYFQVLGLSPALGRLLQPGEDARAGEPALVVLGYDLWRRRFGADRGILGRDVRFNGRALTVVGVAPRGFRGLTGNAEAFVPISLATWFEYPEILDQAGNHWLLAVARLKPGVSVEAAEAEAANAGATVDRQYRFPGQSGIWTATARPLGESRVDPGFRRSMLLLAGAVGLVLLIACVNLTSLLLVRAVSRRREIAVRLALGAARGRLVRQLLTESLILALAGWVVAVMLAKGGVRLLLLLGPGSVGSGNGTSFFFDPATVTVDARVILFALALSLVAAMLVGVVPALQASRPGLTETLKAGGASVGGGAVTLRRPGAHQVLVVSEVALALMLLVGAGLLAKSFARLHGIDPGFAPDHVLTFKFAAADGDYASRDARAFKEAAVTRLSALPGVRSASIGLCAPLTGPCSISVVAQKDDEKFAMGASSVEIGLHPAAPDHFKTLGIGIVKGRGFTPQDRSGSPRVVVINETAARRLWPGQDPIGHRLSAAGGYFAGGDSTALVVGVARDVRYGPLESSMMPDLYYPTYQSGFGAAGTFFLRTEGDPLLVLDAARREIKALDPALPLYNVKTMEERAGAALARPRFAATLLGAFAMMALVLAAIGLYGVMAFSVAQRTREIGLRMALGANAPMVLRGVLLQGLALAGVGVALGLAGAVALQRAVSGMLYGVQPTDPATLAGVSLLMGAAAVVAAAIPARRATRVDPMTALRAE